MEWILPTGAIVSDSNNSLHNTNVLSNGSLVLLMAGLADQGKIAVDCCLLKFFSCNV